MLWLAIESATLVAAVAVGRGQEVLAEISSKVALTHSERLLPMIDQSLGMAGAELGDITHFAVSSGPGSFTGLRIGLSTAKGLAHARNLPIFSVSTLESLAWQQADGIVIPLLDARRGQVYTAIYEKHAAGLRVLEPPSALSLSEFLHSHTTLAGEAVFAGEGATIYRETIEDLVPGATFAPPLNNWPRAAALALLAITDKRAALSVADLRPAYVRLSQAEQKLGGK